MIATLGAVSPARLSGGATSRTTKALTQGFPNTGPASFVEIPGDLAWDTSGTPVRNELKFCPASGRCRQPLGELRTVLACADVPPSDARSSATAVATTSGRTVCGPRTGVVRAIRFTLTGGYTYPGTQSREPRWLGSKVPNPRWSSRPAQADGLDVDGIANGTNAIVRPAEGRVRATPTAPRSLLANLEAPQFARDRLLRSCGLVGGS